MSNLWPRAARGVLAALVLSTPLVVGLNPAAAADPTALKVNEVESNGGTPGDWIEIINTGATATDISGYVIKDNDDTHVFTIPAATTIAAGGYYVADTDAGSGGPGFGLGSADSARLFSPGAATLIDSHTWGPAHAATTFGRCPNGTGSFTTTVSSTKGAANDCGVVAPNVKINEIESNGGTPGDWVEIINNGASVADISGYVVKDNDDTHVFTIPAATTIPAGGYYVADVDPVFGLGSADSARLFTPAAAALVDSHTWGPSHAAITFGRCPNGTGAFADTAASTKGAANSCGIGQVVAVPWPGGAAVATADAAGVFGGNMSGLAYQPSGTSAPGVLWAVKNGPGTLYRLLWDGTKWAPDTANGWAAGKVLRYPDGTGDPDAEGVTLVGNDPANGIFVSTERNNSASSVSRPAVLRFDPSAPGTTLVANADWNLTADLPVLGANLGLEAVEFLPDAFLVGKGFRDEATGAAYDPATYPGHGSGLFFVGVEQNGAIYAYALNQTSGAFTKVATIASGFTGVMDLELESESGPLWAACDDTCTGRSATLDIASSDVNAGRFVATAVYDRPAGMPNINNEGFAITPRAECVGGRKPVFWSDDSNTDGHALRSGTLNCTDRVAQAIAFAQPTSPSIGGAGVPLVATASSGLPVAFAAAGPCSITGTPVAPTLSASRAGSCVVTASQPGDADTAPAPDVVRTVTVGQAASVLTKDRQSIVGSVLGLRVLHSATLTSAVTGQPIAGQSVTFTVSSGAGTGTCTGITNSAGVASCTTSVLTVLSLVLGNSIAQYAGNADYLPAVSFATVYLI